MMGLAISRAIRDFFNLRIVLLVMVPPVVAAIFWIGLVWWNWTLLTTALNDFFMTAEWFKPVLKFAPVVLSADTFNLVNVLVFVGMFAFLFPFVLVSSVMAISILANPVVFAHVLKKHYPQLPPQPVSFWKSIFNTLKASLGFMILWFMSLPLWLIPGGAVAIPLFLSAFLNKKVYSFDAISEVTGEGQVKALADKLNSKFWIAALLCSAFNFFPLAVFVSPIFSALLFIHLSALQVLNDQAVAVKT